MRISSLAVNLKAGNHLITEQTVRVAASCQGIGLHSGAPVSLQILPAPASTGIIFRRVDLDGFEIEAVGKSADVWRRRQRAR